MSDEVDALDMVDDWVESYGRAVGWAGTLRLMIREKARLERTIETQRGDIEKLELEIAKLHRDALLRAPEEASE